MSLGVMSGVNWMRLNEQSSDRASAEASVVLPTPGTSSISTWPRHKMAIIISSTRLFLAHDDLPDVILQKLRKALRHLHRHASYPFVRRAQAEIGSICRAARS